MEQVKHQHHHMNGHAEIDHISEAIEELLAAKAMIEQDHDCSEVLNAIAKVRADLSDTVKLIFEDHVNHCVVDAVETGDKETLHELTDAVNKFL